MTHSGQVRTLKLAWGGCSVDPDPRGRAVVVTIIVEELPAVGLGLKLAVVAPGNPAALKVKLSAKPATREIVTV